MGEDHEPRQKFQLLIPEKWAERSFMVAVFGGVLVSECYGFNHDFYMDGQGYHGGQFLLGSLLGHAIIGAIVGAVIWAAVYFGLEMAGGAIRDRLRGRRDRG